MEEIGVPRENQWNK